MTLKILKQKDFTLLITGKLISLLGSNIQQFALSLYVLALTGSATIFASILSISVLPRLLLSPIAGVFGDWFNRKVSIVSLDLLNSIILGVFAFILFINGDITLIMIYIIVILLEITEIFFSSAMSAVIPSIVKKEEYLEANTMNSLVMNIGQLLAPVLAALVYGVFGLLVVFIVNSISFLISAISEMFIKIPKNNNKPEKINMKAFKKDLKEGLQIIKGNKFISTIIGLGTIVNFCIAPLFSIGLIFIIKEVLEASDFQFGLFQMTLSASMIIAPLLCTGYIKKISVGKLCFACVLMISFLILIMSLVPSGLLVNHSVPQIVPYILILILSFFIGMFVSLTNISVGTLFSQIVPLEAMGRTSTVLNLLITIFIPIGQMIFGFLYDIINPSYVIAICGMIMLVALLKYKTALIQVDSIKDDFKDLEVEAEESIKIEGGAILGEI